MSTGVVDRAERDERARQFVDDCVSEATSEGVNQLAAVLSAAISELSIFRMKLYADGRTPDKSQCAEGRSLAVLLVDSLQTELPVDIRGLVDGVDPDGLIPDCDVAAERVKAKLKEHCVLPAE